MLKIIKRESLYEYELITAEIENDEKVESVKVRTRPDWDNKVIDIIVYFKSGKSASYSGSLSNHKMPTKYRNYITKIMKEVK
jgi:hypothetical protein